MVMSQSEIDKLPTRGHAETRESAIAMAIDTWDGKSDIVVHKEDNSIDYIITAFELQQFKQRVGRRFK